MADAGDPVAALAELDGMAPERMARHQPWWVAKSHVALRAKQPRAASASLAKAIDLTRDVAVRHHLAERLAALEADGAAGS